MLLQDKNDAHSEDLTHKNSNCLSDDFSNYCSHSVAKRNLIMYKLTNVGLIVTMQSTEVPMVNEINFTDILTICTLIFQRWTAEEEAEIERVISASSSSAYLSGWGLRDYYSDNLDIIDWKFQR